MGKLIIKEHPLLMPSMRGTVSCTGCGRLIGRGEGQSFYRFEDGKPVGPAMCYACAQRAEVVDKLEEVAAENEELRTALAGMLESYDLLVAGTSGVVQGTVKGYFIGETDRARQLLGPLGDSEDKPRA